MIKIKVLILTALIGGAVFCFQINVFAYNQTRTHPALTDEIIDFYNLNFPEDKLTEQQKDWLIFGSIQEDTQPRPTNHFYDPVYNKGWENDNTSKDWARSSKLQSAFASNIITGIFELPVSALEDGPYGDYSFERAIKDYASGDKRRAFIAIGHTLHLLEDANVPAHTRGDTHLSLYSSESPYERAMAKWNSNNLNIAKGFYNDGLKPILLNNLDSYFDSVANYSNNYFFSEDTILSKKYSMPDKFIVNIENGELYLHSFDRNGRKVKLAKFISPQIRNLIQESKFTIRDSFILNSYWSRLSKDIIPHGTGALKLFLDKAEEAEEMYAKFKQSEQVNSSLFGRFFNFLFGLFVWDKQSKGQDEILSEIVNKVLYENELTFSDENFENSQTNDSKTLPLVTDNQIKNAKNSNNQENKKDSQQNRNANKNLIQNSTKIPKPTPTPLPADELTSKTNYKNSGKVVINEVAWAGTHASPFDEWIELYNTENYDINLSGWTLKSDDDSPKIVFEGDVVIKTGSYFLIERTDDNTISNIEADVIGKGGLNDKGEALILIDADGKTVDVVGLTGEKWFAGDSQLKISMERIDVQKSGDNPLNWKNFTGNSHIGKDMNGSNINGTPRAKNSPVITVYGGGGGGSTASNQSETDSSSSNPLVSGEEGDTSSTSEDETNLSSEPGNPGEVIINEIAWMGTASSTADEWIELFNTTESEIDLTDWVLKSEDGSLNITFKATASSSSAIDASGYYLIERTDDNTISDIPADMVSSFGHGLNNEGEVLELYDAFGNLQEKVGVSASESEGEGGWYAGINDTSASPPDRYSMERINPQQSGVDSTNWQTNNGININGKDSGGNLILGTPKKQNSVYAGFRPEAIEDLAVTGNGFSNIQLTWTAPEDLDTLTASLSYDIRFSTVSFENKGVWEVSGTMCDVDFTMCDASRTMCDAETVSSGSYPLFIKADAVIPNASYIVKYYLAIKAKDSNDNYSDLSNIVEYQIKSALFDINWSMFGRDNYHSFATDVSGPASPSVDWQFDFEGSNSPHQLVINSDGTVILGVGATTGKLFAISSLGSLSWEFDTIITPSAPAVAADGRVFVGQYDPGTRIYSFDAKNSKSWDFASGDRVNYITLAEDGIIYFTREGSVGFGDEYLYALNPDGKLRWKLSLGIAVSHTAPVVVDNTLYITGRAGSCPRFFAINRHNGAILWQNTFSCQSTIFPQMLSYDSLNNKLYSAAGQYLFEIEPLTGEINKQFVGGTAVTPVTITDDALAAVWTIPASGSVIYAFTNEETTASASEDFEEEKPLKKIKWTFPVPDSIAGNAIIADKDSNYYFATVDGKLWSLSSDGDLRWVYDGGGGAISNSPVLGKNGALYQTFGLKLIKFK